MAKRAAKEDTRTAAGELALIRSIRARRQPPGRGVSLGIGDDCALIGPGAGEEIAITTDFSLEGVHFRRDWHPPESVGHRCLARGLSDLSAMGAKPLGALLSIALPANLTIAGPGERSWFERFLNGFLALAAAHSCPLIGGDTAQPAGEKDGLAIADVVLLGTVRRGSALRRSGAKAGDRIYVTGALGGAAAELLAMERSPGTLGSLTVATPSHPHLYPEPRVAAGLKLTTLATAAIDISDGLSTDLRHLCEGSGLAAEISSLPIHALALQAEKDPSSTRPAVELALNGGEDYELLFTASPATKVPRRIAGVPVTPIGEMKPMRRGRPIVQMLVDGRLVPVEAGGWEHFGAS